MSSSSPISSSSSSLHKSALSKTLKLCFSAPQFTSSATGMVQSVFLNKYYNDVFNVPLTTIAVIIFIVSVLSLYFSVYIGYAGDKYKSRWGRRRPFIAVLGPIKELAFFLLLVPLHSGGETSHVVWFSIFYLVYNMCDEGALVSRQALGTELTQDNQERASLYTWQSGAGLVGIFFAAAASSSLNSVMSQRSAYATMGVAFAVVGVVGFAVLLYFVKENTKYHRKPIPLIPSLNRCMRNHVWLMYIRSVACLGAFNELPGLYSFTVQFVFNKDPDTFISIIIVEYALLQLMCLPLLYKYITKRGKLWVYRFSFLLLAVHGVVFFISTFTSVYVFMISIIFMSLGIAGVNVCAWILLSDCIDYDELLSGKRREATYQAVSAIPSEFFSVGGKALPLIVLNAVGYEPINWKDRHTKHQPDSVTWALRMFITVLPITMSVFALYFFRNYPINESMHERVIGAVEKMHMQSRMHNDYGMNLDSQHADDENENEAVPNCVVDPVTDMLVPVPHVSVSDLDGRSGPGGIDTDEVTQLPLLRDGGGDGDANDGEWLLDHFTSREMCMVSHWGVNELEKELQFSVIVWFVVMSALLFEGGWMAFHHMPYSSFCWLFIGVVASALWLVDIVRVGAARRLAKVPASIQEVMVREHRDQVAKFRLYQTKDSARVADAQFAIDELVRQEDNEWNASWFNRHKQFYGVRALFCIVVLLGVLRLLATNTREQG